MRACQEMKRHGAIVYHFFNDGPRSDDMIRGYYKIYGDKGLLAMNAAVGYCE